MLNVIGKYRKAAGTTKARVIKKCRADLVSFAKLYIANPDLLERFKQNASLNDPDPNTFYTLGERGYTDSPCIQTL